MKEDHLRMKTLLSLLLVVAVTLCGLPARAQYTCSGPPVATGTVGLQSGAAPNPQYITSITEWSAVEKYSLAVMTNVGGPTKLSLGAASGVQVLRGAACLTGPAGAPCQTNGYAPAAGVRATTISLPTTFRQEGATLVAITRVVVNGVKQFELYGAGVVGSIQSTTTFSDGISVIRQDTGANSRFYFEGWHNGAWKSAAARFVSNTCGSIALNELRKDWLREQRVALAQVGFALMPDQAAPKQWWEQLG